MKDNDALIVLRELDRRFPPPAMKNHALLYSATAQCLMLYVWCHEVIRTFSLEDGDLEKGIKLVDEIAVMLKEVSSENSQEATRPAS